MRGAPDQRPHVSRAAGVVSLATLVSRVLGFARDILIARAFGSGLAADAFFVAFGIANLLRRLFGEGALQASFIPVFAGVLERESRESARRLAGASFLALGGILLVATALGVALAEPLTWALAPGFGAEAGKLALTARLTRIMFPYLFFIGLAVLAAGVLNAARHFFAPALSPALLNVAMIGSLLGALAWGAELAEALAWGVVAGGLLQFLFHLPPLWRRGLWPIFSAEFGRPELRRCLLLMLPAAYGMAAAQVNVLVDRWLASFLPGGSVSYLYYGNRLVQLPLGAFGIAIAVAAFPTLSRLAAAEDRGAFRETLLHANRLNLFILLPATVGLIVLAEPIMDVLFRRGEFGPEAMRGSAIALRYYAVGLVFYGGVKTLTSAFYSLQDTRTPVRYANWSVLANLLLNLLLMGPLQHGGLALATSLASALNFALLARGLRPRIGGFGARRAVAESWRLAAAALLMGALLWALVTWVYDPAAGLPLRAGVVVGGVMFGGAIYLLACWFLGCEELGEVERAARRKVASF